MAFTIDTDYKENYLKSKQTWNFKYPEVFITVINSIKTHPAPSLANCVRASHNPF